jgi:DNA-binding NarL/FixJ family response regulator
MIRVILAEDHHLVRQGIRVLLERAEDIEVVAEAADGREAVELVERLAPDVVLMDIAMPRLNGAEATSRIGALDVPTQVVILSMYSDPTLVRQALRSGAVGYVLKRSVTEELLLAIRAASRGEMYLSPSVSGPILMELLAASTPSRVSPLDQLTPREREVLQLIAEGHTNKSIAEALHISVKTVEKHRANVMSKLDVHDVAGLTRLAVKQGLVFLNDQ